MISDGLVLDSLASSALVKPFKVIFIAIRADEALGDGSRQNPFRGNTAVDFDGIMAELVPNTLVVLGPGLFRTAGYQGWRMVEGVIICGSGMFNTSLRLDLAPPVLWQRFGGHAIHGPGEDPVSATPGVAVMDLTIDCNLSGQRAYNTSQPYPRVAVGAIQLNGANMRVQRVRVINFGTRTPLIDAGEDKSHDSNEDFPFFIGGPNVLIEDCIFEMPYVGTARETTVVNFGQEDDSKLPVRIRNCYFNMAVRNPLNGFPVRVVSASRTGLLVTVKTQLPHNLFKAATGKNYVEIKGADQSDYNGRWEISLPTAEDPNSKEFVFKLLATPSNQPTGQMIAQESGQPTLRAITATTILNEEDDLYYLQIETAEPHYRVPTDDWVVISGANWNTSNEDVFNGTYRVKSLHHSATVLCVEIGATDPGSPSGEIWLDQRRTRAPRGTVTGGGGGSLEYSLATYEGHGLKVNDWFMLTGYPSNSKLYSYFKVKTITGPRTITFDATATGATIDYARLLFHFQGISCHTSVGNVMERNRLFNLLKGGDYHDTWAYHDAIIRKNYYYNITYGVWHKLGASDLEYFQAVGYVNRTGKVTAKTGSGPYLLTVQCDANPNDRNVTAISDIVRFYRSGDIATTLSNTPILDIYETGGTWFIKVEVPAPTGGDDPWEVDDAVFFPKYSQQHRIVIEDNLFDLALICLPVGSPDPLAPRAIQVDSDLATPGPYFCQHLVVRGNHIRKVDGQTDHNVDQNTTAMQIYNVARAIIEHNLVDNIFFATPSRYFFSCGHCLNVHAFNNHDSSGKRMRVSVRDGYPGPGTGYIDEVADDVEDWLLNL